MKIKDALTQNLKDAMRAKDEVRKRTIRLALASIKNLEIDRKGVLEDNDILAILQKEVKSRKETIEGAEQAGREDLIIEAEAEIKILESFLPKQLSPEQLRELVQQVINETGAESKREMGEVMKMLMPRVQGRADGKTVSQIVSSLLTS